MRRYASQSFDFKVCCWAAVTAVASLEKEGEREFDMAQAQDPKQLSDDTNT